MKPNQTSLPPMNQSQSEASLREHATHKPVTGDHRAAAALLAAAATIAGLDAQIAELQSQLDKIPALEAALSEDRTKSPAEVRAGLVGIKDQASDLRFQQKRLLDDKTKAFAEAVALFPKCAPLVAGYFSGLYEAERARAVAAIKPFFTVGAATTPERVADDLPTVDAARTNALYSLERVKGEDADATFRKYCEVIAEFGMDKPQAS